MNTELGSVLSKAKKALKRGNQENALHYFTQALSIDPANPVAKKNCKKIRIKLGLPVVGVAPVPEPPQYQIDAIKKRIHTGDYETARRSCEALSEAFPKSVPLLDIWFHLYYAAGEFERCLELCSDMLEVGGSPDLIYYNQGNVYFKQGRDCEAIKSFDRALGFNAKYTDAHNNRGSTLLKLGKLEEAERSFFAASKADPRNLAAFNNLALTRMNLGQFEGALESANSALRLNPKHAEALNVRGLILQALKRFEDAARDLEQAIEIVPTHINAINNLALVLRDAGQNEAALECLRAGLAVFPEHAGTFNNIALIYRDLRRYRDASDSAAMAKKIAPDYLSPYIGHCMTLNYMDGATDSEIFRAHQETGLLIQREAGDRCDLGDRQINSRLKIGYVSGDFRMHSVAYFVEGILEAHDKTEVEVTCYHSSHEEDSVTQRLKASADRWRTVHSATDQELADLIVSDRIDVLVDLAGYTNGNRLGVFAKKPAPVQVTWVGYPNTTGLSTMDYRFVDKVTDPEGADQYHSEHLIRLPGGFNCYTGDDKAPIYKDLPFDRNGYITFGSFNNLSKVGPEVVAAWSRVLSGVPGSRLFLKAGNLKDASIKETLLREFEAEGISRDRIDLVVWTESREEHLALYNEIDIGLDTFPFNGATTTCEAMWMGVPVTTFIGSRHAGRVGASILKQVGIQELVADSVDEMINKTISLARDTEGLRSLRRSLRDQMKESELCAAEPKTRIIEAEYRRMMQKWLRSKEARP